MPNYWKLTASRGIFLPLSISPNNLSTKRYIIYLLMGIVSSRCTLVSGEHTFDDEGSAERQIQSVFDFLEEAEDLDRGCEYWGANPRHSLNVDDEEEMGNVEPKGESSDDDVFLFTFTFDFLFTSFSESFARSQNR